MFSDVQSQKLPNISKEQQEKEYKELLVIFLELLKLRGSERRRVLELLMSKRAQALWQHAINGLAIDNEEALRLLRTTEGLNLKESNMRKSLVAAIDNLSDFAVCEEYQMYKELGLSDYDDEDEDDEEDEEQNVKIFDKYNKRYALVENSDTMFALSVAATLAAYADTTVLVYETQGDNRVRPWHAQWEGYYDTKANFPEWLIPPIEAGCRCFLVEESVQASMNKVQADITPLTRPEWLSPVYSESVAKGGRIFSSAHSYFQVDIKDIDRLRDIASNIKHSVYQWLEG